MNRKLSWIAFLTAGFIGTGISSFAATITDTTVSDFQFLGTILNDTIVSQENSLTDGKVILKPAAGSEFLDDSEFQILGPNPPTWERGQWTTGGGATVSAGSLVVDGGYARTIALFGSGRTLEFRANFTGVENFQNIGFANDLNAAPWAVFGFNNDGNFYARTNDGTAETNTLLPATLLGAYHDYRIEWGTNGEIRFFVENELVTATTLLGGVQMRPIASNVLTGVAQTLVDWMRMTPYPLTGTFTSRVHDAFVPIDWTTLTALTTTPTDTSVSFETRSGNTQDPSTGTWSAFAPVAANNSIASPDNQYLQYRATLTTKNPNVTPVLAQVTINTSRAPTFSQDLPDRTDAEGSEITLPSPATDPDGDSLTYSADGLPAGLSIDQGTGTISGKIAFTAAATNNVTLTVSDGPGGLSTTDTFLWTVTNTNRPPTFNQDLPNQTNAEGATITPLPSPATDPDGDALTYSATGLPTGLSIDQSTGTISGTIAFTAAATNNVTLTVSDGPGGLSATDTFTWTVTNTNRAPTFNQDLLNRTNPKGAVISLSSAATDPDGNALTYSAAGLPTGLSIHTGTGLISGTISPAAAATNNVTVTVSDGSLTATDTFQWTVTTPPPPTRSGGCDSTGMGYAYAQIPLLLLLVFTFVGLRLRRVKRFSRY